MNALFLSASTGGGHAKAAEALMECIRLRNPGSSTFLSDSLKNISPFINRLIVGTYLHTIKKTPVVYDKLYRLSEKDENITDLTMAINRLLSYRLSDSINSFTPSVIICIHTFPLQMVSNLRRRGKISAPVIGIVTDFVNHSFWKLDNVDAFIVAHDYIKDDMVKMGIPGRRIYTFGIPVCSSFRQKKDKNQLLDGLGLRNKDTVLVMGGSLGIGEIKKVFCGLVDCRRDLQIIVVTGSNTSLKAS
jgi:processive 1,2-diacylglycerol beta-glucosyltransferase